MSTIALNEQLFIIVSCKNSMILKIMLFFFQTCFCNFKNSCIVSRCQKITKHFHLFVFKFHKIFFNTFSFKKNILFIFCKNAITIYFFFLIPTNWTNNSCQKFMLVISHFFLLCLNFPNPVKTNTAFIKKYQT